MYVARSTKEIIVCVCIVGSVVDLHSHTNQAYENSVLLECDLRRPLKEPSFFSLARRHRKPLFSALDITQTPTYTLSFSLSLSLPLSFPNPPLSVVPLRLLAWRPK